MLPIIPIICVSYFLLWAFAVHNGPQIPLAPSSQQESIDLGPRLSLEAWIKRQEALSLEKLLDNISPGGKNAEHTVAGTVLASPSKNHPDYFYQWIRDAGITLGTLVDIYAQNATSEFSKIRIEPIMKAYIQLSSKVQQGSNPSGSFDDLSSLGEPKFNVDGTPFTGNWGRPQRDGPALRAITLMSYLRAYNASHQMEWSANRSSTYAGLHSAALPPHSVIKADLEYIARYWSNDGFDLWEEVNGKHFFTAMVQLRALREGAEMADAFGDPAAADWYRLQSKSIEKLLQEFWSDEKGHLVATLDQSRNGLDCALPLGAVHGPGSVSSPFPPHSDEILVSLLYLIKDQRQRFPINSAHAKHAEDDDLAGTGIGRYPSDVYDGYGNSDRGGNPWFICTATAGEIFYHTAIHLFEQQKLVVSSRGLLFWQSLLPKLDIEAEQKYLMGTTEFEQAMVRLRSAGDSFLAIVRKHSAEDGSLSEQFDRETGYERGARDLTWSYGSFLQASEVRRRLMAMY